MATVDEIKIVVQAEVDEAIRRMRELDRVNRQNENTGLDLAKSIAGFTTGYDLAVQAGQKLIAMTGELIKKSVQLAMSQEKVKMEFSVLTGSMENGNKLFADMNKLAAQTPLRLEDITAAGKQLLAVGIPISDVTEKIRFLGDVAMGDAEKLDGLTQAFAQLKSKGVASMEQINRFIEAGVPIMDELGKQTGKTGQELFKFISDGKIGFADVESALRGITSEGNLMHDMMLKVSETTEGKFSSAMDAIDMKLANIGTNSLPVINTMLDSMSRIFGRMNLGDEVTTALKTGKGDFSSLLQQVNAAIKEAEVSDTLKRSLAGIALVSVPAGIALAAIEKEKNDLIAMRDRLMEKTLGQTSLKTGAGVRQIEAKLQAAADAAFKERLDAAIAEGQARDAARAIAEAAAYRDYVDAKRYAKRYEAMNKYVPTALTPGMALAQQSINSIIKLSEQERAKRSLIEGVVGYSWAPTMEKWRQDLIEYGKLIDEMPEQNYDPANDPVYQRLVALAKARKEASEGESITAMLTNAIQSGLTDSVYALGEALAGKENGWQEWEKAGVRAIASVISQWGQAQIVLGFGNIATNPGLAAYQISAGFGAQLVAGGMSQYGAKTRASGKTTNVYNTINVAGSVITEGQLNRASVAAMQKAGRDY